MLFTALCLVGAAMATPAGYASFQLGRRGYLPQDGGCRPGDTLCDSVEADGTGGWCANLKTDPSNCGACGKMCGASFGRCIDGYCPHDDPNACPQGWTGCEGGPIGYFPFTCTDLQNDVCVAGQNCVDGTCTPGSTCPQDYCGGVGCVNKQNDNRHCGKCFNTCEPGQNCVSGVCS
ncbi:hypothetical protein CspeluHIS016_0103940 [Cutaneotrichosporon spelunceum]|uniref:Uncharacterized protein n=1 Tax=Cutaneotrichosporon spelunceum TaxID=1672016 RepID=A0AAD3TNI9_9TREE|nr:hypothetical protein CspeluHIS016_0103940 [Cutaneotrichosporon spelunceum]